MMAILIGMSIFKEIMLGQPMRRTRRNNAEPLQELSYGDRSKKKVKKEVKEQKVAVVKETECYVQHYLPILEKNEQSHYQEQHQTQNVHAQSKQEHKTPQIIQSLQQTYQNPTQSSKGQRPKKYPTRNPKQKTTRVPSRKSRKASTQTKLQATETQAPKKRSRRIQHIAPKTANISLTDIKNLGLNIRKLSSKELQQMCMAFCPQNNERTVGKSTIFSFDLQKLDRLTFRSLQSFVRNKCEERNLAYESMPTDSDDDFVISDDGDI